MENNSEEKLWYVVNTYVGHESKVKENLEMRTESMNMENNIFRVVIPTETEVEIKDGVKKEKTKLMFPGYVIVEMIMSDEAWYVVRNTPGVTGFIGSSGKGAKPTPLMKHEVDKILASIENQNTTYNNDVVVGDSVSIIEGPFKGMFGKVESIEEDNEKLNVLIDLFGQETSVEVDRVQINKN